jgi:hypothetical protein
LISFMCLSPDNIGKTFESLLEQVLQTKFSRPTRSRVSVFMKMIPDQVFRFPGDSAAEKKVFELLRNCPMDGIVLHSLNLSQHKYKKWAEIDFFCVTGFGIFAIEVKGGRISRHLGRWFTNNKPLDESPFDQVRGGFHAFETLLFGDTRGFNSGWGVVFPDSSRVPETPENPEVLQGDFSTCRSQRNFDRWLESLARYWRSKKGKRSSLSSREVLSLVKKLRPNFDVPIPLGEHAERLNERILNFSQEQFDRLDEINENDRIICRGGAGTGKTFLALETARREAARGLKVLFIARSPHLVDWVRSGLPLGNITVLTADELCRQAAIDNMFDLMVADEGQDLLVYSYLETLDRVLRDGFSGGRWRWFMDDQNQSGMHSDTDPDSIEFLQPGATLKRLKKNCRNTREIVESTQYTTGADIGEAELDGNGEYPQIEFVELDTECDRIFRCLRKWHDDGVGWDRMIVLVCDGREHRRITQGASGRVRVETVLDFKGLEADFVALGGISADPDSLESLRAEIYTGMTRARIHLFVAVPLALKDAWQKIREENASRMLSADEKV